MRHTSMNLPTSRLHMANSIVITLCIMIPFCSVNAQIDGDNIFSLDQVISIELTFPQEEFWGDLQLNYVADENEYIPAMLTLTDVSGTHIMDSVGVRLKGNSSYFHPGVKKSFKIDFNKFIPGQNYDGLKKLNFSNGFKDPTCMREKLFFDACLDAGVPAPRASFANVTFNGEAWGFYTVVEQIDDQFLDWAIEEDSGNLFKAGNNFGGGGGPGGGGGGNNTAADLVDYGTNPAMYADRYVLKTNEDVNDWSDLISFIDFINNTELNAFAAGIDFRMDVDGFLRSAALDMLFSNLDSYTGSARNYYIYHNQDTNHWEWIKWDGNEAFGSYTNGAGNMETVAIDYTNPTRPLLERMFDHDDLYSRYLDHVCELTETLFNETHLHERIDVLTELIASSVYADDNKMYSNADFDVNLVSNLSGGGGPMGGTTYGLKSFVTNRSAYVASQLECQTVSDVETHAPSLHAFPNPAQHEVMVDGLPKNSDVSLLNASGRVVFQTLTRDTSMLRIDVSALAEGVYIVRSSQGWAERLLIVR